MTFSLSQKSGIYKDICFFLAGLFWGLCLTGAFFYPQIANGIDLNTYSNLYPWVSIVDDIGTLQPEVSGSYIMGISASLNDVLDVVQNGSTVDNTLARCAQGSNAGSNINFTTRMNSVYVNPAFDSSCSEYAGQVYFFIGALGDFSVAYGMNGGTWIDIFDLTDFTPDSNLVFEQTNQYINILKPVYGTTTASTTIDIEVSFSTPFSIDFRPETIRKIEILDAVTLESQLVLTDNVAANTAENFVFSTSTTLTPGSKFIRAGYYTTDDILYSELAESFFSVATNTYFISTGLNNPRENPSGLSQIDCATFDVGCQFQKALVFLFYPPSDSLNRFANIWQSIRDKKPFGYVTVTIDELTGLDSNATPAFDLGTVPFMDSIFTPFKTLLSGILWALFFIYWYHRRLKTLEI